MECFNPVKIHLSDDNRKERLLNSDLPVSERVRTYYYVRCGKCEACLSLRRSQWAFRLTKELENSESAYFLTLTYDDEHLPYDKKVVNGEEVYVQTVCKKDVQLFFKRLRKSIQPFKIRYFLVSEYGPKTFRPHYHLILFNFPNALKRKLDDYLQNAWNLGFITVAPVNSSRINYVCSYCLDYSMLPKHLNKNFMLCSRRPGLGHAYLEHNNTVSYHRNNMDFNGYVISGTKPYKIPLPRYYRDKLFTDVERLKNSSELSQFHFKKRVELVEKQREWLRRNGFEDTILNLYLPYPGSPMSAKMYERNDFKKRVISKCKMKKNG